MCVVEFLTIKKMNEQKIYRLIAEYKIEQAFESLFSLLEKINKQNSHDKSKDALIVLSARFHDLMHQKLIGIVSSADSILESNKIIHGILQINQTLIDSKEYKDTHFILEKDQSYHKLIIDTSNCDIQQEIEHWETYNTRRKFENIRTEIKLNEINWEIIAEYNELVGVNRSLNFIEGKVTFEYLPIKFNAVKDNLLFFMIPMKSNRNLLEVGTNLIDDRHNGYSPFRIRQLANPNLNQWHKGEITFDFTNTPEARCSVFAFRINEGTPRADSGIMKVKNIKIYKTIKNK